MDPHESTAQTISQSVFALHTHVNNRQTDRETDRETDTRTTLCATSVAIGRMQCMCSLKIPSHLLYYTR